MEESQKLIDALRWIKNILESEHIPYQISGGLAAHIYGSQRPVNDIDLVIPEKDFQKVFERTKEYVTEGPGRHRGKKWDLELLTLDYEGQEIDIGGAETTKITMKDSTGNDTDEWVLLTTDFDKSVMMDFHGMVLPLEPKESLAAYKKHLNGEHQKEDIKALEHV